MYYLLSLSYAKWAPFAKWETLNCIAPCKQSALWAYLGHRQCHGPFPPSGTNPEDGFQVPYSAYRTI